MSVGHSVAPRERGRTRGARAGHTLPAAPTRRCPPRNAPLGRPALVRALAEARGASVTLVVAPPGYGKSTLLADWAAYDERAFVWLAAGTPLPGGPEQVLDRPHRADRISTAGSAQSDGADALLALVRRTCRRDESFVCVLDDADLLHPRVLRNLFEVALNELPEGSMMALASRSEPPLPLARLRAYGLLSEIRTQQLAMTSAEAAALLARNGVDLDFELVQRLVRRTEGWPAMLSLAALTMRESPQDTVEFDGQHHLVSEYVKDEVLASLPSELQAFAIRTSMLDELSGPICDRVLERRDSAAAIQRLARGTSLLLPKDRAHTSYRWHTLVREALGAELARTDHELERTLRLRAAAWYSETGDTERALDQCSLAAEAELTGDLLWPNLLAYLTNGKAASVRRWISRFQSDRVDNVPLALAAAFSALVGGNPNDDVQRWGVAAAAARAQSSGEPEGQSLSTGLALIGTIDAHDGLGRMEERAIDAVRSEPVDSLWRPVGLLLAGVAAYLQGDRCTAEPRLDEAARLSGSRAPALTALSISQRAMIAIEHEDWELAEELTERAQALLEEWGLRRDPLSAFTYAAAAASQARQRRIDEAKHHLRRGIELLAALGEFLPWYGAQARILLAHASLWLADVVAARALLAEASRFARRTPGAVIFSDWFDRAWAHMDTLTETSLAGPSALTIAELRILRFLPSHRSFREIAAQLGVSANTVKTQAHAVYRKLGVASRSEAVARAIEAGLLA